MDLSPARAAGRALRDPGRRGRSAGPVLAAAVAVATVVCVIALLLAGGGPQPVPTGLPDPGPVVGWGLRLTRTGALLAAVLTVGSLLVAGVLRPEDADLRHRALRGAAGAAWFWAAAAGAGVLLSAADTAGVPLTEVGVDLLLRWGATGPGLAAVATATAASAMAVISPRLASVGASRVMLVTALATALVVPLSGHGLENGDAGAVAVHVVAALVWTGGLAGLVVHLRGDPASLAAAVPRFSTVALVAFAVLAGSGLLAAVDTAGLLRPGASPWTSGYVAVLGAKVVVLLLLGWVGVRHRRRSLPRLAAGAPGAFRVLATSEMLLMGAGLGLAAALARTPLPPTPGDPLGHDATGGDVAELSLTSLVTAWRPDAIVLLVLGLSVLWYLHSVRSLRGAGIGWPVARSAAFVSGILVALVALCSGVAAYAPLLLSLHLAQLLVVLLVVPPLLLLGRPLTLATSTGRGGPPPGVARALANPATGAVATCVLLTLLLRTALVTWSLSSPWWHLLVLAAATGCGLALLWPALGTGEPPERRSGPEQAGWLLTVAVGLTVLGVQLRLGDRLVAADWFLELRLGWADPVGDQQWAGAIVMGFAAGLGLLALLLAGRTSGQGGQTLPQTVPSRSSAGTAP